MRNRKHVILFALVLVFIIIAVFRGHDDSGSQNVTEHEQVKPDESIVISTPEPTPNQPASEIETGPVSEDMEKKQEEFNQLVNEDDTIVFAESGWPNTYLGDKSLFKIKVTDVMCNEKDLIVYLLNRADKAYQMDSINFDSVFERHKVLRDLTGIKNAGDSYCTFCKINMDIERIWSYDDEHTLSLNRGLFSAKYYSKVLGEYAGTDFDSGSTLFFVGDCKSDELLFDKTSNSYQLEVITVVHYAEYSNDYDEYNVMFNGTIVSNGRFNIRELNGG